MKQFVGREIRAFLRSVDAHLKRPFRLVVIGGAAASLSFRIRSGTVDIDTANNVSPIEDASEKARKETGLAIPLGRASVIDGPYEYESRLKRVPLKGLKKLQVFVPEKHDWALMKTVRLYEKDIEDIKEVARAAGLNKKILLKRFLDEMTHVIGPQKSLKDNFFTIMAELYGDREADRVEEIVNRHKHWS